jgi:hypothetical protein
MGHPTSLRYPPFPHRTIIHISCLSAAFKEWCLVGLELARANTIPFYMIYTAFLKKDITSVSAIPPIQRQQLTINYKQSR